MKTESKQKLYLITVVLESGAIRDVHVRAATIKAAHRRALKRTPNSASIKKSCVIPHEIGL